MDNIVNESLLARIAKNRLDPNLIGTNELDCFMPLPVACLSGNNKQHFFIPSYQRGYRWEQDQIQDLLDDLNEFMSKDNNDEIYWLQPIVIKKKQWLKKEINETVTGWEVVDGQQRLTSILLLLNYISETKDELYDITYETRPGINFSDIVSIDENADIDSDYIKNNYQYIINWFENEAKKTDSEISDLKNDFRDCLARRDARKISKMAAFIVYILDANTKDIKDNTNELVKKFNNLNKNQIKLTGSELLKAQFFLSFYKTKNDSEFITKWNQMEYTLQNNDFWNFISNEPEKSTRIDILFDIFTNKKENELKKDYSYRKIKKELFDKSDKDKYLLDVWENIKSIFETIKLCYEVRTIRYYAGFLTTVRAKTWNELYEDLNKLNKQQLVKTFNSYICTFLEKTLKEKDSIVKSSNETKMINRDVLDRLDYDYDSTAIRNLLLLHNIIYCIKSEDYNFSFADYKDIKNICQLEHIDPHTPNELKKYEDASIYINGMSERALNFLWEDDKLNSIKDQLKLLQKESQDIKQSSLTKNEIDSKKKEFVIKATKFIEEYKNRLNDYRNSKNQNAQLNQHSINSIANLTLLNYDINESYHNRPFPDKHVTVLNAELDGKFIPPCTKFAFSKKYSNDFKTISDPDWNEEDKKAYFNDIVKNFNQVLTGELKNESKIY